MRKALKAPYPYFGGKSRVADLVWQRFGDVPNYVEPFAGSCAVLLARPSVPQTETINDLHGFIPNFWRAIAAEPDAVAHYADWPILETDLFARHVWLVRQVEVLSDCLRCDPDYYDVKIAGWWVWSACAWIGSGWCETASAEVAKLPHLLGGRGINSQSGRANYDTWFAALSKRLRNVRVCNGDWSRVTGEGITHLHGLTAVFLDPPYDPKSRAKVYAQEADITADVLAYCQANGQNPLMRIGVCGYADGCGYEVLEREGWTVTAWKSAGGYGSQGAERGRDNANRERIWFSPACIPPAQGGLFCDPQTNRRQVPRARRCVLPRGRRV